MNNNTDRLSLVDRHIVIDDLPRGSQDLARIATLPAFIELVKRRPGCNMNVVTNPADDHVFFEVMSRDDALRVFNMFRGCSIRIPSLNTIRQSARNRLIKQDYERGVNISDLTTKYQIADITIRKILRGK